MHNQHLKIKFKNKRKYAQRTYVLKRKLIVWIECIPLNSGAIRNTVKAPVFENCPKHVSIKNNGIPQNVNINKYGNKNAPAKNFICES